MALLKLVKNILTIVLLLVFIISTSGITILSHYCSGSKKTIRSILPELSGSQEGCGGMSCSKSFKIALERESISKASCCKENSVFYKIAVVETPPVNQFSIKIPFNNLIAPDLYLATLASSEITNTHFPQVHCESPPVAGKQLVVFLQQLRIPSPSCIS
jgi:hypothetical protein